MPLPLLPPRFPTPATPRIPHGSCCFVVVESRKNVQEPIWHTMWCVPLSIASVVNWLARFPDTGVRDRMGILGVLRSSVRFSPYINIHSFLARFPKKSCCVQTITRLENAYRTMGVMRTGRAFRIRYAKGLWPETRSVNSESGNKGSGVGNRPDNSVAHRGS